MLLPGKRRVIDIDVVKRIKKKQKEEQITEKQAKRITRKYVEKVMRQQVDPFIKKRFPKQKRKKFLRTLRFWYVLELFEYVE